MTRRRDERSRKQMLRRQVYPYDWVYPVMAPAASEWTRGLEAMGKLLLREKEYMESVLDKDDWNVLASLIGIYTTPEADEDDPGHALAVTVAHAEKMLSKSQNYYGKNKESRFDKLLETLRNLSYIQGQYVIHTIHWLHYFEDDLKRNDEWWNLSFRQSFEYV